MNANAGCLSRRELVKLMLATGVISAVSAENALAQIENTAPKRLLVVALQHGWGLSGTSNRGTTLVDGQPNFPLGLEPFNEIKHHCTVINSLLTLGEWGNNHDLSYADILTAGVPFGAATSAYDSQMPLSIKPSIDFLLQEYSGKPSYRFCASYKSWGVQYHPLSFDKNQSVLPYYTNAFDAYNSLLKQYNESAQQLSVSASTESTLTQNVLQFVSQSAKSLVENNNFPAYEKEKVGRYVDAVSAVEKKLGVSLPQSGGAKLFAIPASGQASLTDLPQYLDMVRVGFANNFTTSAVIGIGDIIEHKDFHHLHAHSNSDIYWQTRSDFSQHVVKFVKDLENTVDVDGKSVLDNTFIVLTGEVGDGRHELIQKGHIVIGGASRIKTGRILTVPTVTGAAKAAISREDTRGALTSSVRWSSIASTRSNADLWREIGNHCGLKLQEFGLASQNFGDLL
jgi:hypothetical protein